MEIVDRIYGHIEIDTPVLQELINSEPVQRLKGIHQFGVPNKYYHLAGGSRFGHSIGTMLVCRNLDGSVEEQSSALLHDVSHTAFSHVYDWVVESQQKPGSQEDLQDQNHHNFFFNSELPEILQRHGLDPSRVADHHNFGLLEQPSPDLCADRVDYCLRESISDWYSIFLPALRTQNNRIVMSERSPAVNFASLFLAKQKGHWGGVEAVRRYHHFSQALRFALENGDISMHDFSLDDFAVLVKVEDSGDPRIKKQLEILKQPYIPDPKGDSETVFKKFRYVDPIYPASELEERLFGVEAGTMLRASEVSRQFKLSLEEARTQNQQGVKVSIDY